MTREDAAVMAIGKLCALLGDRSIIRISYDYADPHVLSVVVGDALASTATAPYLPKDIAIFDHGQQFDFKVTIAVGAQIVPSIGAARDIPAHKMALPAQGGDPCYVRGSDSWGTAGLVFQSLSLTVQTAAATYVVSASNGFLSNNHVIAQLDKLPRGTPLVENTFPGDPVLATATLAGFIPTSDTRAQLDLAAGTGLSPANYDSLMLRGIGKANNVFRNPANNGEAIRKSGARTRVTNGQTTGRTAISAGGAVLGGSRYYGAAKHVPHVDVFHFDEGGGLGLALVGRVHVNDNRTHERGPTLIDLYVCFNQMFLGLGRNLRELAARHLDNWPPVAIQDAGCLARCVHGIGCCCWSHNSPQSLN
jgi:hypothetical protein